MLSYIPKLNKSSPNSKNHTAVKELLKRRKELEKDIAKIDADISVLNQENLTNKEGVYWNKDAINTMILQLDEGSDWVDTPLGSKTP
jgi:hypothetical protein